MLLLTPELLILRVFLVVCGLIFWLRDNFQVSKTQTRFIGIKSIFSMRKYVRNIFIENVQGVFIEYPGCNHRVKI
ncbi:hypothetical protein HMPREF2981_06200 [Rothia sp. HMSC069C01]|nr:hypothetical protein HMPREF2981_06200 [Rothia sp. HMSC069C01]OFR96009.1 hypothetical protein HMPREF2756_03115 [Rothia sp. HMSC067H10]